VNAQTLRNLEFDRIKRLLVRHAGSKTAQGRLEALAPLRNAEAVRDALGHTREGVHLLARLGRQPYHDLPEVGELLARARIRDLFLEPLALVDVASFIEGALEITRRVAREDGAPRLAGRASQVKDASDVAAAIRRAVLPSGEVADDASPRLADLRRALVRLRGQLHSVMESYLRDRDTERLLQDKVVTTRNDRYVLVVKSDHKSQLDGVVHGSSGSGQSVFVEPLPAVTLNNEIVEVQDEERREVVRILTDLTSRVGARSTDLAAAEAVLAELDAAQAKALLAREMTAVEPEIVDRPELRLPEARHPLLMPDLLAHLEPERARAKAPVPVSLEISAERPVLVISGPNTGGKTVALKTLGLFPLMAQCGLFLPTGEGARLPVFRRVYADIGDDQSIAASLSTFSAHLAAIVEMTRDLEAPALVLLDEVGAGTDPTEGGALGVAIVDHFRARGAMVAATTHHGLMKAYAQSTPGVESGSFGYDPHTYEPTYRLSLGAPGRSLALEMAERLGLPAAVVRDARARRDDKEAQAEALLARLEREKADLEQKQAQVEAARVEVDGLLARQRAAEKALREKQQVELKAFTRELDRRGEEAARKAAAAIRDAVQRVEQSPRRAAVEGGKARAQVAARVAEARAEALRDTGVAAEIDAERPAAPVAVGARVRVQSLGVVGQVLALEDGEAELAVGGKRLRVPRPELVVVAPAGGSRNAPAAPRPRAAAGPSASAGTPSEINIVGLRVDEALPRVDKGLDQAAVADRRLVRVIHGFGEGKLRKAVAGLLDGHPHVQSFRAGGPSEGGGGVTIVELKE
jgi:DNA mismatch repair protein MutS2